MAIKTLDGKVFMEILDSLYCSERQLTLLENSLLRNLRKKSRKLTEKEIKEVSEDPDLFTGKYSHLGGISIYILNNYAPERGLITKPAWIEKVPYERVELNHMKESQGGEITLKSPFIARATKIVSGNLKYIHLDSDKKREVNIWDVVYFK